MNSNAWWATGHTQTLSSCEQRGSSQEKGLAGRIQSAKLSYKRSKRCLWVQRAGGWEDQMSVPTTNILCYLVCTVRDFRSPEVNLWHCTTQKVPSWKIFDSNIWQDLFFCSSEKGWDWADPSEVPQLCLQRQFQCPADCFGCVFMSFCLLDCSPHLPIQRQGPFKPCMNEPLINSIFEKFWLYPSVIKRN